MNETEILEVVMRNLIAVVPDLHPGLVSMDSDLANLGCTSIDRAEVATMTMEELGILVPIMEFQHLGSVSALVGVLRRHV